MMLTILFVFYATLKSFLDVSIVFSSKMLVFQDLVNYTRAKGCVCRPMKTVKSVVFKIVLTLVVVLEVFFKYISVCLLAKSIFVFKRDKFFVPGGLTHFLSSLMACGIQQ